MTKKIALTGTESTGKTILTMQLAQHYQTVFVPDYSRNYIANLSRTYDYSDVLEIAKGIIAQEAKMLALAKEMLFSDNDLINIKIWLQYYQWEVPDWLEEAIVKNKPDLYLLCDVDIPWVADGQRSNPHDREKLFSRFSKELKAVNANFRLVAGEGDERLQSAITSVDEWWYSR